MVLKCFAVFFDCVFFFFGQGVQLLFLLIFNFFDTLAVVIIEKRTSCTFSIDFIRVDFYGMFRGLWMNMTMP